MRRTVWSRAAAGTAALLVGFVGGVRLHEAVVRAEEPRAVDRAIDPSARDDPAVRPACPALAPAPPYPVNERGMTYGSGVDDDGPGPDLVGAVGADGTCGFVRASDRVSGARTPATALGSSGAAGRRVPLYARDGVTVIGSVRVGPRGSTAPAPEQAPSGR